MLDKLFAALCATGIPFKTYGWAVAPATDYGVFSPEGEADALWADGEQLAQATEGTIDLFCRSASRAAMEKVQAALRAMDGIAWRLLSTQFEEETKLVHYEWVFQVVTFCGEDASDGA